MTKLPTLEIYIPVFNEEKNILNILDDIYAQRANTFILTKVVIVCDGCTDNTTQIVRKNLSKYPRLDIMVGNKNKGKLARLNQIYKMASCSLLVTLDADIRLIGDHFLEQLIFPLVNDRHNLMVSANQIPVRPDNFLGKVIYQSFVNWDKVWQSIPDCDTIHSFGAAATAYRGSFAKTLNIPSGAKEERMYLYLSAKQKGGYVYNKQSTILYRTVATLPEWIGLTHRSFGEQDVAVEHIFNVDSDTILKIPLKNKLFGIINAVMQSPIYSVLGLVLNIIIANYKNHQYVSSVSIWEYSKSTKVPIDTSNYNEN